MQGRGSLHYFVQGTILTWSSTAAELFIVQGNVRSFSVFYSIYLPNIGTGLVGEVIK